MTRIRRASAGALAALVLGATAACGAGGSGGPDPGDPTPTTAGSATATASATPSASPTPPGSAAPEGEPAEGFAPATATAEAEPSGARVTVVDVRVGSHDGYDRVVYEVAGGGVPGYRVGYVDQAVQDGSGEAVDVAGEAVLDVWLTGTGYPHDTGHDEFAQDVGPREGTVVQVTRPLTFEGMTQSVVGVAGERRPFRVFVLQDPVRVVVDVQSS
ncbi:hypothetical protein GXP71_02355 [Cellulomonas sp. H30R-01]|uniref:AMIN-like domain-containing (lipo)protein n=1 Tax=Cellulomonas sp. H30R-01 TaxID=2704467 RepID=UPI00138C7053|nr:hypothetical protein [Cellulomonas sp. H30R-01]QHT55041.1 hypothetical protein GXP71_02355 [Cellulomonas sp. H30R-01]